MITVRAAVRTFIKDPNSGPQTDQSRDKYRATLERFASEGNPLAPIDSVTTHDIIRFMEGFEVAASTRRTYFNRLESFFNWCVLKDLLAENPVRPARAHFPAKPKPVKQHNWLSKDQVEEVYRALKHESVSPTIGLRDLAVLMLGFTMGLRRQEIATIRWVDVDLVDQSLKIKGKGDKLAKLWIPGRTANVLSTLHNQYIKDPTYVRHEDDTVIPPMLVNHAVVDGFVYNSVGYRWGRQISNSAISHIVARASNWAGIDFSPHDMRRSYAGQLEELGYGIEVISKALRHSDFGVTQRYLKGRQDAAYQALSGLDF